MNEYQSALYEEKPTDEFLDVYKNGSEGEHTRVNLSALTYYASLSLKPRRIGVLVGCSHTTIWANNQLRQAYENGAAYHELWLRTIVMDKARASGDLALKMMGRAVGTEEQDVLEGQNPTDIADTVPTWVAVPPTFPKPTALTESEREEIEGEQE